MMWHIIGILVFVVIYNLYRYYREDNDNDYSESTATTPDSNQIEEKRMEETISTRQLALRTIENIGSKPEYTEEGRIQFKYQGVIFLMETSEESVFVKLVWPWCYSCSLHDVENFARVRKAMNEVNRFGRCVMSYYPVPESCEASVFIQKEFLLIPQIPQLDDYLKSIINILFGAARTLELEIEKCRMQDCEKHY